MNKPDINKLIELMGDQYGSLERTKDGSFVAKQANGIWIIKSDPQRAMESLYKHIKLGILN